MLLLLMVLLLLEELVRAGGVVGMLGAGRVDGALLLQGRRSRSDPVFSCFCCCCCWLVSFKAAMVASSDMFT